MISAILDCACGHAPALVSRSGKKWYQCKACGESGSKASDIPGAARAWNDKQARRNNP